jgi:2,3-bisphosphoglycerate-independent phosphoglycerate mutase
MNREKIVANLSQKTRSKIVLLVVDGLGGVASDGQTELEAAETPNLDRLAAAGVCGLTDPVFRGITPGSGPAHLSLFGYEPTSYLLGRGILEALGVGVMVGRDDLVARGNFATLQEGLITDRRAGRITTEENQRLCQQRSSRLKEIDSASIHLKPGKEHRFVVKFSRKDLSDRLSDADPQKENEAPVPALALSEEAAPSAEVVNRFIRSVSDILQAEPKANTVLLRGFSKHPVIPRLQELYKLSPAAIANYPMYRGLAKLVGMDLIPVGGETSDLLDALEVHYDSYDFFFIHYKKTDSSGEDGNFEAKIKAIEDLDRFIPRIAALHPDVLAVTSDHSTPCRMKGHSWHPNPLLIRAANAQRDKVDRFSERACAGGYLGRFRAVEVMPLILAHAGKLKKFGA